MRKVTNFFASMSIILLAICFSNTAAAAPINLNNFYTDPDFNPTVTVAGDGLSAFIEEDSFSSVVLLSNQPSLGDPNIIDPDIYTTLSFNYEFIEGIDNDDEFRVNLFNTDTYDDDSILPLLDFFTSDTSSGLVSFDLSGFAGLNLGLDFELRSFDNFLDSTVRIFDVRLDTQSVTPVPEPSTTYSFLLGMLLLLLVKRRLR